MTKATDSIAPPACCPATWEYHNSSAIQLQVGGLEKQPNCENTHLSCRYVYLPGKGEA